MRKFFLSVIFTLAACLGASAQESHSSIPPYDKLQSSAKDALKRQEYKAAYNTYCLMDSAYGITSADYESMMYFMWLTHSYNPGSEDEKSLMFRAVNSKWFDMAQLELEAANYGVDTLDYWDELAAIVTPRGYQDTLYQNRLLAMTRADQALRNSIGNGSQNEDSLKAALHEVEVRNEAELKQLIAERGFPTLTRVGSLCNDYATYIAQHSEPEFLHWFLEQAKPAADNGLFDLSWIAYMTDRDLIHQGKPQLYGTQLTTIDGITAFDPIEEIEHLDERRASMGLGPIADYMKLYGMTELKTHLVK